eukprot:jgi/Bigna1/143557/aug1.79_g18265
MPLIRNRRNLTEVREMMARRRLNYSSTFNTSQVPMGGDFLKDGEYFIEIQVGKNNPKPFRVQVDTGSSDLGIPALGCSGCEEHIDTWYNPDETGAELLPCNNNLNCGMSVSYADGSGFKGVLYQDTVAFGSIKSPALVGAIYHQASKHFQPYTIDGIIGFAYSSQSSSGGPTAFESMVAAGVVDNIFAMCLHGKGGQMYFGSEVMKTAENLGEIKWVKQTSEGFYPVRMLDLKVGGESIGVPPEIFNRGEAIVDSGSTAITLPRTAFDGLRDFFYKKCKNGAKLKGICSQTHNAPLSKTLFNAEMCVAMSEDEIAAYPAFQFEFTDGVVLELRPEHYLMTGSLLCDKEGYYSLGISSGNVADGSILGDNFMQPFLTIFDRANQRVGFVAISPDQCR